MRNGLVHKPVAPPDAADVKSVLAAVQDLLGMLDYYSGAGMYGAVNIRRPVEVLWRRLDLPKQPE